MRSKGGLPAFLVISMFVLSRNSAVAAEPADIILYNGHVITVDNAFSIKKAVVVKGDRIVAVGDDDLLKKYKAPTKIDLRGKTLMPGFVDTHVHISAASKRQIDIGHAKSFAEIRKMLQAKAAELGPGEWITGNGWDEGNFLERRAPTAKELDQWAPNNPVFLPRAHSAIANTLALKAAGIDARTPNPDKGVIDHDANGEPNGTLRESATRLVSNLVPKELWGDARSGYVQSLKSYFALGITSIFSASTSLDDEPVNQGGIPNPGSGLTFRRLQEIETHEVVPRVTAFIAYPGSERLKQYPHHTGYGDDKARIGPIGEAGLDGGFGGMAAWLLHDYIHDPGFRGVATMTEAQMDDMLETGASLGWQFGVHMIGDAALVQGVAGYDRALAKHPVVGDHKGEDRRWFTAHFIVLPPARTMETMEKDHILSESQPNFGITFAGRYIDSLSPEQLKHNNPIATPAHTYHILMAGGGDSQPTDPRVGIYYAVTRKDRDGNVEGLKEEGISRPEAIRMYTANGPYLSWEEKIKGTIEAGKLADMIVLDSDPLTIPEQQILTLQVDQTYLGGKLVFDRAAESTRP